MGLRRWFERPLRPGTKVAVIPDPQFGGPFRGRCTGRIQSSQRAAGLTPSAARRNKFVYWVMFDTPQYDLDGDGPYRSSQVLSQYVIAL